MLLLLLAAIVNRHMPSPSIHPFMRTCLIETMTAYVSSAIDATRSVSLSVCLLFSFPL